MGFFGRKRLTELTGIVLTFIHFLEKAREKRQGRERVEGVRLRPPRFTMAGGSNGTSVVLTGKGTMEM